MMQVLKLDDLVRGLELSLRQLLVYLNPTTGQVAAITPEAFHAAEKGGSDSGKGWEQMETRLAAEILDNADWMRLPTRQDVDEYDIMHRFVRNVVVNEAKIDELNRVLQSGLAERRWEMVVTGLNLADDWQRFRRQMFRRAMKNWCAIHELDYEE
ncbi:MAG: hypothetical protein JNN12_09180 [Bacteroidetes Order II. Incertae sedis bacterium]|nr:hypothetical protein [Bacteroidetes Order II. bacterium]